MTVDAPREIVLPRRREPNVALAVRPNPAPAPPVEKVGTLEVRHPRKRRRWRVYRCGNGPDFSRYRLVSASGRGERVVTRSKLEEFEIVSPAGLTWADVL